MNISFQPQIDGQTNMVMVFWKYVITNQKCWVDLVMFWFTQLRKIDNGDNAIENNYKKCCNPSLGLTTKARAHEGACQEWNPRITFHVLGSVGECEGMNPHIPSELPLWELESNWIPKSSEGNFRGHNSWIEILFIPLKSSWNVNV
jgi:hypothetical protein